MMGMMTSSLIKGLEWPSWRLPDVLYWQTSQDLVKLHKLSVLLSV